MTTRWSRRDAILRAGTCLGAAAVVGSPAIAATARGAKPFGYCLNTATIGGRKVKLEEQVRIAAAAGYTGIELWIRDIKQYADGGGSLPDMKRRIAESGLSVEGAVGFPSWCVDDDDRRAKGMEQMKSDMELAVKLGAKRIAAPPSGATREPVADLFKVSERYRAILELGRKTGVTPQLEIWGPSKTLGRLGEAVLVAAGANHPDAGLLLDAYHLHRGGSGFEGLRLLNGAAMHLFHINDYPGDVPPGELRDFHRIYPGDGGAPMTSLLKTLHATGFRGMLSLELFNRDYLAKGPEAVARTGLQKMKAAVEKALG